MELIKSTSIEALIAKRDAGLKYLEQARELVVKASEAMTGVGVSLGAAIRGNRYYYENALLTDCELETAMKRVDAQLWDFLLKESGIRTFMDAKAREEWSKAIHDVKTPPLTRENIEATFTRLYDSRGDLFERGVIECFKGLSWCYKTNLPQKFGKRIVVSYIRGYDSRAANKMDDLDRVFHLMDKKPEPDHRNSAGLKLEELARKTTTGEATFDYFSARWYKNGNAHVTFKRPDLVDQLNRIIAKHFPNALPEPK